MLDQGTKQRAGFELIASAEPLARRDEWVRHRNSTLVHRDFLRGLFLGDALIARIMLVPERSFKAVSGLAAKCRAIRISQGGAAIRRNPPQNLR
jgi:hypothetical protein